MKTLNACIERLATINALGVRDKLNGGYGSGLDINTVVNTLCVSYSHSKAGLYIKVREAFALEELKAERYE
jgi:hypothetical protein